MSAKTSAVKRPIRWSRDVHHRPSNDEVANYRYKWTGQDFADFIALSMYPGVQARDDAYRGPASYTTSAPRFTKSSRNTDRWQKCSFSQ
jgi:hypothetical protein